MPSSRTLPLSAFLSVCVFATSAFAQKVGPTVRITSPINSSQLVTLKGTVHPLANPQNDRGPAPQSMQLTRMHLILKRSPAQDTALRQLIQEQNTPGSPNYHKWLTPAQFAAEFGPSKQDIATVENWLAGQGFTINKLEPGNQVLDISGTVAQLSSAFHTEIHRYMVNGQLHYANANAPSIPAALAPVVGGFVSLNNFHYRNYAQSLGEATYNPSTGQAKPSWTIGSGSFDYQKYNFVLSPADYAVQYDLNPLYSAGITGAGQSIAIVNESNININLVNQFRSLFNLPPNPPQIIIDGNDPGIDGINNPDGPNYASVEAYLDVEWAGAVAPDATIYLVIAADTSLESGLALAAERAVYSDVAPVVSVSFGLCELFQGSSNVFWNNLWQQAAAQGQTVLVSTGDSGSAGCDASSSQYASNGLAVNGLASTPYDVAVGGTDFFYSSYNQGSSAINTQLSGYWNTTASNSTATVSLLKPIPEQPWNDSQYGLDLFDYNANTGSSTVAGGSGGKSSAALCANNAYSSTTGLCSGTTSGYPKPAWQTGIAGIPTDGVRDLPDVSLFAADGMNDSYYPICATDGDCQPVSSGNLVQIFGVGGTSAAAPSFAGIMALVNQYQTLRLGSPQRQGQANTVLYPLKAQFPAAFHDVTRGTNSVPCEISPSVTPSCISVSNPLTIQISSSGGLTSNITEGQLGSGSTASYDAAAGYNLATGLGSIDAYQLVTNWGNVKLGSTSVSLTPTTATTFTHGTAFKFNGTVTGSSGTPTGDVAIMTDSTEMSQQGASNFGLDSSGNYSGSLTTLPGGSYNIWASYGGDSKNAAAVSSKTAITVNPENSGIAFGLFESGANLSSGQYLTSSPSSGIDYGTQLMLSARVAPSADVSALQSCTPSGSTTTCPSGYSAPTGTITFKDSSTPLNTAVINSEGDAEFNAPFTVGQHSVSASYSGDNSYNPSSTTTPITFTVVKDTPAINAFTTVTDTSNNLINGPSQPTVLTIEISNGAQTPPSSSTSSSTSIYSVPVAPPTGNVTLSSSLSGLSGTVALSPFVDPSTGAQAGIATFTVPAGSVNNTYTVKVGYSGDSNYNSLSASNNQFSIPIVTTSGDGYITSTIAATASGSISPNTTITISGTVTGQSGHPAPTGTIYLYSSGSYPAMAALKAPSSGYTSTFSITLDSQTLFQGSNQLTLQYVGDTNYNPSAYVFTTAVSNPLSDFTMIPQTTTVPVDLGSSGTATDIVNVSSVNGFSGNVNLSCTTPSGLAITCNITNPVSLTSGSSSAATLTITVPPATANGNYNIFITGKDAATGEFIHTAAITAAVTGSTASTSSFALSNDGNINVKMTGSASSGSGTITVTPEGGFTGSVALTCSVTSPPGATSPATCTVASPVTITNGTAQTATLTINITGTTTGGAYLVTVTGTSGAISSTTAVTANVTVPGLDVSNSGSISISAPGNSGNSTITVTPTGGFTGTVNLSCSVSPSGSNAPSCGLNPASVDITDTNAQTATLTVNTSGSTPTGTYTVTVIGTSGTISTSTSVGVSVGNPDFSMTSNPTSLTVTAGATTGNTSTITVQSTDGFANTVNLTCAISPAAASHPATCSLNPASVTPAANGTATATITISTTATTTSMNDNKSKFWPSAGGGAVLACLLFFWIPKKRRSWLAMVVLLVFFVSMAGMACGGGGGGGSNSGGTTNPGTTAGTYTVTVTGTSGSLSHTATVSLTVK